MKAPAPKKGGDVRSVEFTPAKGGLVSETRIRFKRGGQGGGPDYDHETEMAVHPTLQHAAAHLKTKFGHVFNEHPEPAESPAE